MRAIFTYVRANFESPADYDRLAASYSLQREQLMHATGYTDYGEEPDEAGDGE
jgi:predicted transcriptional regulator